MHPHRIPHVCLPLLISPLLVFAANQMLAECGHQTYGSPQLEDCHSLLESFANHLDTKIRVFDEEQQRTTEDGSWPGLLDITGAAHLDDAVQLPRYFSLSKGVLNSIFYIFLKKCRFLLLRHNVLRRLRRRPLPLRRHKLVQNKLRRKLPNDEMSPQCQNRIRRSRCHT